MLYQQPCYKNASKTEDVAQFHLSVRSTDLKTQHSAFTHAHFMKHFDSREKNTAVESLPSSISSADEELGSIGVGSCIGHGQSAQAHVLQGEVLISELLTIDGLATSPVVVCEVTSLTCRELKEQI